MHRPDGNWWGRRLSLNHRECYIRISQAISPQQLEDFGLLIPSVQQQLKEKGFTYASLELGQLIAIDDVYGRTLLSHHLTLAYLFLIESPTDREFLHHRMQTIVVKVALVPPLQRPYELVPWRKCLVKESSDDVDPTDVRYIIDLSDDDLTQLLSEDRIELPYWKGDKPLREEVLRLAKRDRERWWTFYEAERGLIESNVHADTDLNSRGGTLVMNEPDSGLGAFSELHMLLLYLRDCMHHTPCCWGRTERGKMIQPGYLEPHQWHCTPQGSWTEVPN